MHSHVRRAQPGKCPSCNMALIEEGARLGLLQHMLSSPLHITAMITVMVLLMAAAMVLLR